VTKNKIILKAAGSIVGIALLLFISSIILVNNFITKDEPQYTSFSAEDQSINFLWARKSLNNHVLDKVAMLLALQIKGIQDELYFQFDTGARNSIIYSNALESLRQAGMAFEIVSKNDKRFVKKINLIVGGNMLTINMLEIQQQEGNDIPIVLGSLGVDLISNKITEIDYKNKKINFYKERQAWMTRNNDFTKYDSRGNRLILPCILNGETQYFLFDTGCSSFGLITTKSIYKTLSNPNSNEIKYNLSTWGRANRWNREVEVYQRQSNEFILISGVNLGLETVSYFDFFSGYQDLLKPFAAVDGWLGNLSFLRHSLIFDFSTSEFVVIKK
jgi:hypothetical protein